MPLAPVARASLSDEVFRQLLDAIVGGELVPGESLPAERVLCEQLRVNRGAVREAVKRLVQAGLVESVHGAGNVVLDYRQTAGMDLLPYLFERDPSDPGLVLSVMEMRSAIGPEVAAACARRMPGQGAFIEGLVPRMQRTPPDLTRLQALHLSMWEALIDGAGNLAFRLAFNSLRRVYDPVRASLAAVLFGELTDFATVARIGRAVATGDADAARDASSILLGRGLAAFSRELASPREPTMHGPPATPFAIAHAPRREARTP